MPGKAKVHPRPPTSHLRIALPEPSASYRQDQEWCLVQIDEIWQEVRFHDYARIYQIEGLYERLFYDVLQCDSPRTVIRLLRAALADSRVQPSELRVLDLGAGNGLMGQEVSVLGVDRVIGIDIHLEAAHAADRDRPGVYKDYLVADLTDLSPADSRRLAEHAPNSLCCVAALGFGDIPTEAFRAAYNLLPEGGWAAFTLKEEFLSTRTDDSGFSHLIQRALDTGAMERRTTVRYRHRLSTSGDPIHYVAIIATKQSDI